MKLRKVFIPFITTVLLTLAAVPVLASEIRPETNSGGTTVKAQVASGYTVVIPESMTGSDSLKAGINTIGYIRLTGMCLKPGERLTCTLSGDTLTHEGGTETLPYNAWYGDDKTCKTVTLDRDINRVAVNVEVDNNGLATAKEGVYKTTLNFDIQIITN